MLNRLNSLRLHTIIRGHHQDYDIGHLCASRTHCREGGMTGGVQKTDHALLGGDVIGTNVLGNATRFTGCHAGGANEIKE